MANVKRIQFRETIGAPVARVWEVMLDPENYQRWTAAFCEGSSFDGSWDQGSKMRFLDPAGNGMIAEIAESRLHEFISIRHLGYIMDGVEDTESESVRAWAPAFENYSFSSVAEGTRIVVDQDVTEEYEESMKESWPKALSLLKEICEGEGEA
jgi:uncharacterized protein YndB with AHSA1/START domain